MPETIENYTPQADFKAYEKRARRVWIFTFGLALIWMFLIVLAPVAESRQLTGISQPIYSFFGNLCHQMSWRSLHIGEHPLAVCSRCFGFYGGFFLGLAIYPLFRSVSNTEPFARFWLFAAMIPMGIDWGLTFFDIWENTHLSRVVTGGILGAACAFFILPALVEISYLFREKFQRG